MKEKFGSQLKLQVKELRELRGMTQKELADQMQVSFQTISKWENGVNMPDVMHIPRLAEIFGVSADVILGLETLKQKPDWRRFDGIDYWNGNRKLFKLWKSLYWNDDYFAFLVREVWKLDRPVDVLDFGCGFGFLGRKLLPLLPEESTYTGIELDPGELKEAESFLKEHGYPYELIQQDVYQYEPKEEYDLVVALYLMSYVKHPERLLEKVKASLRPGGMAILIDSNMEVERAGYFSGWEREENGRKCPDFTEVWESEVSHRERDYRMGTKLPYLMKKAGFQNVQARISDRVILYDPSDEEKKETNDVFRYVYEHEDSFQGGPEYFAARGAEYPKACEYADYYKRTKEYFDSAEPFAVKTAGLYFVYARKGGE